MSGFVSVTVDLDLEAVVTKLREELDLIEDYSGEEVTTGTIAGEAAQPRPTRVKQATKN